MNFEETFYGRPNTIRVYTSLFRNHIKPHVNFVDAPGTEWLESDTLSMLRAWDNKGLSKKTQNTLIRLLSKYVVHLGGSKINTTPFIRTMNRATQKKELEVFSASEAVLLMDVCKRMEPNFYPILLLALHAGMRRGEIYGLHYDDVDMIKGKIRVERSYNGPTKNGKTRYLPMSKEMSNFLMTYRCWGVGQERVFSLEDPNPILRRLCAHAKIKELNFHALRHSFATLALESGTSPKQVQVWLGHSSLTTTLDIYWNLTGEEASLDFLPGGPS